MGKHQNSLTSLIVNRIEELSYGFAFTASDFYDIAPTDTINRILSRLENIGTIRRIASGIYDKPEYSTFLGEYSAPNIQSVAAALARKFNWTVVPAGDTARNILHLSTQVPNTWEYISDGPYKKYIIGNRTLLFKTRSNRDTKMSPFSAIVIEALKAGNKENQEMDIKILRENLSEEEKKILEKESTRSTMWIQKSIKKICEA